MTTYRREGTDSQYQAALHNLRLKNAEQRVLIAKL